MIEVRGGHGIAEPGEPEPPLHGLVTVAGLPLQVRVVLLTGSTRAAERRDALNAIRFGGADLGVAIGHGGAERMIVYPAMLWLLALGRGKLVVIAIPLVLLGVAAAWTAATLAFMLANRRT